MPTLTVAHDIVCPWCWVGRIQSKRLREEFPTLSFNWKGYELLPEGVAYTPDPPDPEEDRKPKTPTRFELMLAAEDLRIPKRSRDLSCTRLALEGAEFAAEMGRIEPYLDAIYQLYWEEDRDIAHRDILREDAKRGKLDTAEFDAALNNRIYRERIVEFDAPAHAAGIWNVPTWMFPEGWVAEQPYSVLRDKMAQFIANSA